MKRHHPQVGQVEQGPVLWPVVSSPPLPVFPVACLPVLPRHDQQPEHHREVEQELRLRVDWPEHVRAE